MDSCPDCEKLKARLKQTADGACVITYDTVYAPLGGEAWAHRVGPRGFPFMLNKSPEVVANLYWDGGVWAASVSIEKSFSTKEACELFISRSQRTKARRQNEY